MTSDRTESGGAEPAVGRTASAKGGPGYIPGFDGMRAIAVMLVLGAHAGYGDALPGGLGVTIFFTISGFLIATLLIEESAKTGSIDLVRFYIRRFLRLYPELIVLIGLCGLSALFLPLMATLAEKGAGLFYYMNYYLIVGAHYPPDNTYPWQQLWSLSVEEHFYFLFPAAMLLWRARGQRLILMALAVTVPLLWRLIAHYPLGLPWQYNYVATEARIDSIAWGCLIAILMHRADGARAPLPSLRFVRGSVVIVAGAIMIVSLLYRSEDFRWTWRFSLQGLSIALLIANLLFDPRYRRIVAMLEWKPVRFIGRISYGLYLYHLLVNRWIEEVYPGLPNPVLLVSSVTLSVAVAAVSYRLVEVPLKPLRRKLGSHTR